ncbi:MAG: Xaa-Pro aminopeptidase (EC [uncultured Paraburkholderia sp.]|nr:MAG: Xaa-Pro aminopeptidase (EC [uncultured Paraburkholderia sp.]CAH2921750.1 MAG: Xaa-Pro aminopeptidase (EC [uncultured Paraburkholderia sp.]
MVVKPARRRRQLQPGVRRASLFVADGKVPQALADALACDGITVEPYAKAAEALTATR